MTLASPAYFRGRPDGWPIIIKLVPRGIWPEPTVAGTATEDGTTPFSRKTAQSWPPPLTERTTLAQEYSESAGIALPARMLTLVAPNTMRFELQLLLSMQWPAVDTRLGAIRVPEHEPQVIWVLNLRPLGQRSVLHGAPALRGARAQPKKREKKGK